MFSKDNPTGQVKGKRKRADRRRGGKTISKNGQEWALPAQLGQMKTGQDGKGLLRIHLWCPDDLPRLWDRIEIESMAKHTSYRTSCSSNLNQL